MNDGRPRGAFGVTTKQRVCTIRRRAIAVGGRRLNGEEERSALPVELLAVAVGGLPDLAAAALIGIDLIDRSLPGEAVRRARQEARQGASTTLRLCQRALEADARNGGYEWQPWVERTVTDTAILLDGDGSAESGYRDSLHHASALARALGRATAGLTYDRMSVPEALCVGQTHALVLILAAEASSPVPGD